MDGDDASALALALARDHHDLHAAMDRSDDDGGGEEEEEAEYYDDADDDMEAADEYEAAARLARVSDEDMDVSIPIAVEAPMFQAVHHSWAEFEAAVKAYAADTYQLYVVRTTTSVKTRNSRIAELGTGVAVDDDHHHGGRHDSTEKMQIPSHWRWYSKTMMCTHGWKDRHRGKGKRTPLMIRSTGCPVKMCATLQFNRDVGDDGAWQVVVTKHVRTHNHPLTKDLLLYYTENRRMYDPDLLAIGGSGYAGEADGDHGDDSDDTALAERSQSSGLQPMAPKSFASWELFHKTLQDYSVVTDQHFRIRSTISSLARNSKLITVATKNGKTVQDIAAQLVPDAQKWHSKLFICDFGWKRKSRSKLQQNQPHLSDGSEFRETTHPCPAMIMARLQRDVHDKWRVVISRQVLEHNHEDQDIDSRALDLDQAFPGDTNLRDEHEGGNAMENDDDEEKASSLGHPVDLLDDSVDHLSNDEPSSPIHLAHEDANDSMFELSSHDYESSTQLDHHHTHEDNDDAVSVVTQVVVRVPRLTPVHESWDAFHATLQHYSEATYQSYRTRTTTSAKGRNQKIGEMRSTAGKKDSTGGPGAARPIPDEYGWYSKTLTCTHGWKERRRGSGKRAIQAIRSTACPVKICATLQFVDANGSPTSGDGAWRVIVTKHVVNHNHNLSRELYRLYCNNRRIYDPDLLAIDTSGAAATPASPQSHESSDTDMARSVPTRSRMGTQTRPYPTVAEMDRSEAYAARQVAPDTAFASAPSSVLTDRPPLPGYSSHSAMSLIPFTSVVSSGTVLLPPQRESSEQHVFNQPALFTPGSYLNSTDAPANSSALYASASTTHSSEEAITNPKRREYDEIESTEPSKRPRTSDEVQAIAPRFQIYSMRAGPDDASASLPPIWTAANNVQAVVVTEPDGSEVYRVPRLKRRHETWEEFGDYLAAYSAATYQLYRVRTTSSIAARNARISKQKHHIARDDHEDEDDDGMEDDLGAPGQLVPSSYEWYSKTYVCTHGWKTRHRGKGQRVSHHLRSTACPAKLCVTLQRDPHNATNWNVVVTKHLPDHNHEISAAVFHSYSTNRQVKDPEVLAKAEQMWREGQPRRNVFEYLKEETDGRILMKDVHNLVQKWQQQQGQSQPRDGLLHTEEEDDDEAAAHRQSSTRNSDLSVDELMV